MDPNVIEEMFGKWGDDVQYIGVNAGKSGLIILDIDKKNGKDGFQELENQWHTVPDTEWYPTENNGEHHVFLAPDDDYYPPQAPYRGMEGVDRRSGGSYAVWYGDVPKRENFAVAPEWLTDKGVVHPEYAFDGDRDQWIMGLTPGSPSLFVRNAIEKLEGQADIGHAEMVAAQFNAVRLGAEGHPGVPELLGKIKTLWLNRPAESHSTPEHEWQHKYEEALESAIIKYGRQIELLEELPDFDPNVVPARAHDIFFGTGEADNSQWSSALGALIKAPLDDATIASTLWHGPRTMPLSREWGIEFVYDRIQIARDRPEPTRENPAMEDEGKIEETFDGLLSDRERGRVEDMFSFEDVYRTEALNMGFINEKYTRASAWTCSSMAFAFHGFLPKSGTDKMGVNLWFMILGESGTGKSRTAKTYTTVLSTLLDGDDDDSSFRLGADSSQQGLNVALLTRDMKPSIVDKDEASSFFQQLGKNDWMSGLDNTLAHWYEGRVDPSNKLNLKDLRGKSALTSFNMHMFATPDDLFDLVNRDMFKTGFLARFTWIIGDPPIDTDDRFLIHQDEDGGDMEFDDVSPEIQRLALDLHTASSSLGDRPMPILMDRDCRTRLSEAYRAMYRGAEGRENFDIIEPSITRLVETMQKIAAMNAMYQGRTEANLGDALIAIDTIEEWYTNLFEVAGRVSSGEFQRNADAVSAYVRLHKRVTHEKLFHQFRNLIVRSQRDIEDVVDFLITSGQINRVHEDKRVVYVPNGGE